MFNSQSVVKKTRKNHGCEQCLKRIEAGSECYKFVGYWEDFYHGYEHSDCHDAFMNYPGRECLNYDESPPPLHELEREDWPWLLKEYPGVAARLNLVERTAS